MEIDMATLQKQPIKLVITDNVTPALREASYTVNRFALLEQIEGRYIYTPDNYYRPVENGTVTIYKPVMVNRVCKGGVAVPIDLLKHCSRDELQELLDKSICQDEYEAWWMDQARAYQSMADGVQG